VEWANDQNERLGGTDDIAFYDSSAVQIGRVDMAVRPSATVVDAASSSSLPLVEIPSVGVIDVRIDVRVCATAADVDTVVAETYGYVDYAENVRSDGTTVECAVDLREEPVGILVCDSFIRDFFSSVAVVQRGRVLIEIRSSFGLDTSVDGAVTAMEELTAIVTDRIDARLTEA
jgi:hypothetical protein